MRFGVMAMQLDYLVPAMAGPGSIQDFVAGFDHARSRPNPHRHQDKADILGIHDLGIAFQVFNQVRQGGLQHEERAAVVADHLAAPRFSDQVVVVEVDKGDLFAFQDIRHSGRVENGPRVPPESRTFGQHHLTRP